MGCEFQNYFAGFQNYFAGASRTRSAYPCHRAGKVAILDRRFPLLFGISRTFVSFKTL